MGVDNGVFHGFIGHHFKVSIVSQESGPVGLPPAYDAGINNFICLFSGDRPSVRELRKS